MKKILCNKNIFFCSQIKRKRSQVKGIVIHYTGNKDDTAIANANYFKNNNERYAGAHFVIGVDGNIIKCGNLNDVCWSVGNDMREHKVPNSGKYYGDYGNSNTVSIELCDIVDNFPTTKQINSTIKVIKYIRRHCKNAKLIMRHWDVNGKHCPATMCYLNNKEWKKFVSKLKIGLKSYKDFKYTK